MYKTKRSARMARQASGMVRSSSANKLDWSLIGDGPMLKRWAELLDRGAKIYGKRNWLKALRSGSRSELEAVLVRFEESTWRHFMQWAHGARDEDHAAAVVFNLNGYEACRDALASLPKRAPKITTSWKKRRRPARKPLTDAGTVAKAKSMSI